MSKRSASMKLNITNPAEEMLARFMHGLTPWLVWLAGVPALAAAFRILAVTTHQVRWVTLGLAASTILLTWFTWRMSHMRSTTGRHHHAVNTVTALGIITAVASAGPTRPLLAVYAVAGLTLSIAWNLRYGSHADADDDVLTVRRPRQKLINGGYLIRALTGHAPMIRVAAEKTAKVIPAANAAFREQPAVAPSADRPAISGTVVEDAPTAKDMHVAYQRAALIKSKFKDLAANKQPDLAGARLSIRSVHPWRIKGEVQLVKGVQTPKVVLSVREELASQCAMPLASIIATPNPKRHDRVFLDFVLQDVLRNKLAWPGPLAVGQSIAAAPCRVGMYEDRQMAERFGPAITAEMANTLGRGEKNLAHLLLEGMNGSGKSTWQRVQVTDAATRCDVVEWLVDTVKKFQTFGPMGEAFDWFATTVGEAQAMIKFLAQAVIPERANWLGLNGYDNWVSTCGLPYLRVTIEEGGIIGNELEQLVDALNSARSAGVEIDFSIQRAHNALMDTNARAQFPESVSFGCKQADDSFVMPDELGEAGADPSQWQNKNPGMNYYAGAELDLERMIIPMRGFDIDMAVAQAIMREHIPAREQWIAGNCPEWALMLARIDRNGVYAKRTTGLAVFAQIEKARIKREGHDYTATVVHVDEPIHSIPATAITADDAQDEPGEDDAVTLDELEIDDEEVLAGMKDDEAEQIDPRHPLPEVDPADDFQFPRPDSPLTRDQSLAALRSWLVGKGEGFECAPRDIYNDDELMARIGKSAGWIRTEMSTTLIAEGALEQTDDLRGEGKYRVCGPRLRLASAG